MRILTTNNFRYKKTAAKDPYRQMTQIIQKMNGILQGYWKNINKYAQNPVQLQKLAQDLFKNLTKMSNTLTSLNIPVTQQVGQVIGNFLGQLQTTMQQIPTGVPGSLNSDGSVVQPVNLNGIATILQELNQNITKTMTEGTAQYGQQQGQELDQRRQQQPGQPQQTGQPGQPQQPQPGQQQPQRPGQGQPGQPQAPQGPSEQQRPGQRGKRPKRPMVKPNEVDWNKIFRRGHVTKGNATKFLNSHGGFGSQMLQRLGVPASWYGLPETQLSKETKWPSSSKEGWSDPTTNQNYPQNFQRQQFNTGLKSLYNDFVSQFGLEEGHKKAVELLGPGSKGSLGISFRGSYYSEGLAAGGLPGDIFEFGGELGEFSPSRYRDPMTTQRVSKEYQEKGTGTGAALDLGQSALDWEKAIKGQGSIY